MSFVPEITNCLNYILLELTPLQRLDAIRKLHGDSNTNPWYTAIGIAVVVVLIVVLVIINRRHKKDKPKPAHQVFSEDGKRRGLTDRESQLLWDIAGEAGLQRNGAIFTLPTAFERGETKVVQKCLVEHGSEQSKHLQIELSFLREKLGFHKTARSLSTITTKPEELSSRHIHAGKKLYIRPHRSTERGDLESIVIQNNPSELSVQIDRQVEIAFGQPWRCRYYSGTSVWEFDTTVISCSGNTVSLQHSDNIRLINRRKFLRVPTQKRASIAPFPLIKRSEATVNGPRKKTDLINDISQNSADLLKSPEFVPATITELAGPGLRVDANLNVKVHDRVLIMFKLNSTKAINPVSAAREITGEKIIESLASVRHVRANRNNSMSLALEMTGLSEQEIDELIRITHEAAVAINKNNKQSAALEFVSS